MAAPGSVTSARTSAYQTAQEHDSSSPDPADPHSPIGYWTPAPSRLVTQYEAGDEDEDEDDTPRAVAFQRALEEKAVEASGSSPVLLERYMDQDRTPAATPVLEVPLTRLQARLRASQASQTSSAVSTPTTSAMKIKTRSSSRHRQSPLPATSPLPPHSGNTLRPADPYPSSSLEQLESTIVEDTVIHVQEDKMDEANTPDQPQTIPENEDETEIIAPGDYVDLPKPRVVIYVPTQSTPLSEPPGSTTTTDLLSKSPIPANTRMSDQASDERRSDHSRTSSTISNPADRLPVAGDESVIESFTSTAPSGKDNPDTSTLALTTRPRLREIFIPTRKSSKVTEYTRKAAFDEKRSRDKHASQRRRRQLHKKRKRMFSCANGPVYSRALF